LFGPEPLDPLNISGVVRESVIRHLPDVSSAMTMRANQSIEHPSEHGRDAVIEENPQSAASWCSKATALLTERCGTI
jgi:hypothetical protein